MNVRIAEDWKAILQPEFEKPYFGKLVDFVRTEYASHTVFPQGGNIFRAFDKCPLLTIQCHKGTYGEEYAKAHHIKCEYVSS